MDGGDFIVKFEAGEEMQEEEEEEEMEGSEGATMGVGLVFMRSFDEAREEERREEEGRS